MVLGMQAAQNNLMPLRRLGTTGLSVSVIGLGTMTWGRDTLPDDCAGQLADFYAAGGNLVDTAASYGAGAAEETLGSLLGQVVPREDLILVSKAGVRRTRSGSVVDASRANLLRTLDESLRRLHTDYLDLWLIQSPDSAVAFEESLGALAQAVSSGKVRYVGLSNHPAWLTARAATLLSPQVGGLSAPGLAAVEVEYSLLSRGIEREVLPAARSLRFGTLAWSPLGRGVLTGKYRSSTPPDSRAASPHLAGFVTPYLGPASRQIVEALATAAEGLGRLPLEVALSWVLDHQQISSAIVGARTIDQLRAILRGLDLRLPAQIRQVLDEVSAPQIGYPEVLGER